MDDKWDGKKVEGKVTKFTSMSCKAQYDTLLRLFAFVKNTFVMKLFRQLYTGEIPIRNRKKQSIYKPYCRTVLAILRAVGPHDLCWTSCRCVIELVMRYSGSLHGQQLLVQDPGMPGTHPSLCKA